jgi:excisionase family DNA binding protein
MRAPDLDALPLALTVKQAARLAEVDPSTLYDAIARDDCPWPVLRLGRAIRIPRAAVLESLGLGEPESRQGTT